MEAPLRSNGSNTHQTLQTQRMATRSRVAARVERVLNTALAGQGSGSLNVTATELLSEPMAVAGVIGSALDRPGVGVKGHSQVHDVLRRSKVYSELIDALASKNPVTRAAAARVCGAARMTEAVVWLGDLLADSNPRVRDAAGRGLAQMGGRRAVEQLMSAGDRIPVYRLAIALSRAASDLDIEGLMRQPTTEDAAVATVLACGLRRDLLRVPPLLGIIHDRRWPKQVRLAAMKALATIGDRSAADGLHRLALSDPDPAVKAVADRAYRRLVRRAVGR